MKKRISFLSLILVILLSNVLVGCTKKEAKDFSQLKERGNFIVGFDDTFVPMGFKDEKGEIVGFDIDLAKEVSKRIGLDVKFQPIDWSMKETELNAVNVDVLWNGYTITEERKKKVDFTNPYLENRQIIITLKDSPINTKEDLKDKKVGTQNGSSAVDAINKEPEFVENLKDGELVLFDTNNEALMDLEAKRVDAVVADEILARYYIAKRGETNYKVLKEDFGNEMYGIGVRKESKELLKEINKALDEMKKDGTSEKISKKWFGENIVK